MCLLKIDVARDMIQASVMLSISWICSNDEILSEAKKI